jgi:hypothetical protein
MTPDQLIDLLEKAGMLEEESPGVLGWHPTMKKAECFTALAAAAERNKLAQWMIDHSYATGHGDTTEDLLQELEWQIAENWTRGMVNGVEAEREACAVVARQWDADHPASNYGGCIANLIEARGQDAA